MSDRRDSMNEKIVTHEDLEPLLHARAKWADGSAPALVLDRLIEAAKADQPPLPEGWYWVERGEGRCAAYVKDGLISPFDSGEDTWGSVDRYRNRLTPLRPTVTEADVERAVRAARAVYLNGMDNWDEVSRGRREDWMETVRAALDALDIEVRPTA